MLLLIAGCGGKQTPPPAAPVAPPTGPWIKAEPNPVPAGDAAGRTTTISWDTLDPQLKAEIVVLVPGKPEAKFATGTTKFQKTADWISPGGQYTFVLKSMSDGKELARTTVTKAK